MIPRSRKFPLRTQYYEWRRRAKTLHSPHFVLYYLSSISTPRVGLILPRRKLPTAVARNQLRRHLYPSLLALADNHLLDLVVILKAKGVGVDNKIYDEELKSSLAQL